MVGYVGCASQDQSDPSTPISTVSDGPAFLNLNDDVAFVGDDACFTCHEDQYTGFKEHGMANAIYELTAESEIENFDGTVVLDSTLGY